LLFLLLAAIASWSGESNQLSRKQHLRKGGSYQHSLDQEGVSL